MSGLPVVNAVLGRLGFDRLLSSYLPESDHRCELEPARAIGVLARSLALGRQPLYGLGSWAAGFHPALLGLRPGEAELLNDDRVGRALDQALRGGPGQSHHRPEHGGDPRLRVDCSELHNDSNLICLYVPRPTIPLDTGLGR